MAIAELGKSPSLEGKLASQEVIGDRIQKIVAASLLNLESQKKQDRQVGLSCKDRMNGVTTLERLVLRNPNFDPDFPEGVLIIERRTFSSEKPVLNRQISPLVNISEIRRYVFAGFYQPAVVLLEAEENIIRMDQMTAYRACCPHIKPTSFLAIESPDPTLDLIQSIYLWQKMPSDGVVYKGIVNRILTPGI